MRSMIEAACPSHGIVGEEFGTHNGGAEFVWVLDPIDGTQAFVTGKPLFGTLIALLHEGQPVLGIIDVPAMAERWIGVSGQPTLFQGKPACVRACDSVGDAWLYATSPQMFTEHNFPRFEKLRKQTRRAVYGAECYGYGLVASGWTDMVCEDTLQPYDYAAIVPIIEGAGGIMTDWQGRRLGLESDGTVLASGSAAIHEQAIDFLRLT